MDNPKISITFSNDSKIILTKESILYPVRVSGTLTEHSPLILSDSYNPNSGYVEALTTFFSSCEYFTIDEDGLVDVMVYKTSAIVAFKQYDSNLTKSSMFKR